MALRSLWGAEELDAVAITPEFAPGDVVVIDSWCAVLRTRSVFSHSRPKCGRGLRRLPHRVESNFDDESKVGLINVFCRPDCVSLDTRAGSGAYLPVMRAGKVLPPTAAAAAEVQEASKL